MYSQEYVRENETLKILGDFEIKKKDHSIPAKKPDLELIIDKNK